MCMSMCWAFCHFKVKNDCYSFFLEVLQSVSSSVSQRPIYWPASCLCLCVNQCSSQAANLAKTFKQTCAHGCPM